jgi:hypothetical protein
LAPANCTVAPSAQDLLLSDVPLSGERVVNEDWTISCSQVGEYTFTFANSISADTEHVRAFDSAGLELRVSVNVNVNTYLNANAYGNAGGLAHHGDPYTDGGPRYSDSDTSFANDRSCHSHTRCTATDRRQRRTVVDRRLACAGVVG